MEPWIVRVDPQCLKAFEERFGAIVMEGLAVSGKDYQSLRRRAECTRMFQTYWTGWVDAKEAEGDA